MRKYSFYLGFFSLCLLILSGCGKLERKGTPASNTPPVVYFADIPPEATEFSVNPPVRWFGTDVDGFIAAYQYAVMEKDSVFSRWDSLEEVKSLLHDILPDSVSWVDQITLTNMLGAHVVAEPGGHTRNVMMYADTVDTIYTPQYIFLRAVDNRGAVSEVEHLMLSRNNHRPKALIDMVDSAAMAAFAAKGHYCLEETTATWKGISISWKGWDSLDYPNPRIQPEFQFKWELVGPFDDSLDSPFEAETTYVVDSSLTSLLIAGEWRPTRWVSEKTHVFKGLENSGDLGYGWYQLRVRARDDALVSHDTAATLNFRILKPKFRYADSLSKTILVVDATAYGGKDGGAADPADIRPFYEKALKYLSQLEPPLCDEWEMWYDPESPPNQVGKNAPEEDVLSRYDLTIVLNLGSNPSISSGNYKTYKEYLNIGGRLWLIGLNNFSLGLSNDKPQSVSEAQYFGIDEVFAPSWTPTDSMTLEFIQAKPFGLWEGLPTLKVDSVKCQDLKGYDPNWTVGNYFNFGVRGIPYVCYDALSNKLDFAKRIPYQRRIYTFISYYPSISLMHEKPCAVNYIGPTYRTAEFCFPLNLMKNDAGEVFEVMGKLVDEFFWEDLP